jgi:hypothetical protein
MKPVDFSKMVPICIASHPKILKDTLWFTDIHVFYTRLSNVKWLALLLNVQKVQYSNLGLKTGYSEIFHHFLHSLQANAGIVPQNETTTASSTCFQFTIH